MIVVCMYGVCVCVEATPSKDEESPAKEGTPSEDTPPAESAEGEVGVASEDKAEDEALKVNVTEADEPAAEEAEDTKESSPG